MMKYIKFYRYLIPFWKREIFILCLSGVSMAVALVNPYLAKLILDKAYHNKDLKLFILLVIIGGMLFILSSIINALANYLNRYIRLKIGFDLNCKVFKKLQNLSYGFFQDSTTGQHLYKISYDIEQVVRFITDVLPQAVSFIPKAVFILIIVFYLNWKMALFALALMPLLYIAPYYFTRRLKKIMKIEIEKSQGIFVWLQEVLSHMQLIKAFGKERYQIRQYIAGLIDYTRLGLTNIRLGLANSFVNGIANRLILGLIIFYGGYKVIKGQMSLGTFSAITIYLSQLSGIHNSIANFFQQVSLGLISCERLEVILEAEPSTREDRQSKEAIFSKGEILFQNVTFGYATHLQEIPEPNKHYKIVLESLNFYIKGGSCIGLVGPSGCGKTTMVNLILRLYQLDGGEIAIDGQDIGLIKAKSFYKQIGVVLQEPYLWDDSIENNIRYGREDASFKDVREAAAIACIDEFINELPEGYHTFIGENACKISEGQKQRLAIARAVIKNPKILILDEALSSVDVEVEARIIENIRNSLKDSTIVVISHRLSTIRKMDLVYFLAGPNRVDIGRHEEMLENNLKYQNYLNYQLDKEKVLF